MDFVTPEPVTAMRRSLPLQKSELNRNAVSGYLLGEWQFANIFVSMSVLDLLVEALIEQGVLVLPEDGIGAEDCWMAVAK